MYRSMNPYDRELQTTLRRQIEDIKERVYTYRAMGPGDLGYGYSDSVEYIFITGAGDIEKSIPSFSLPIVDTERFSRPIIIVDMRRYAKNILIRPENDLKSMLLAKSDYETYIDSALMLGSYIEGSMILKDVWYKAFSFIAVNTISNELNLDPYDRTSLHIVILAYMIDLLDNDRNNDAKDFIIANNMLLNGLKVDTTDVKEVTKNLDREDLTISKLVENINRCSEDRRLKKLTLSFVLGTINKLVFSKDVPYIMNSFDYPELFIPLLNTYINNAFMKRTKFVQSYKYISRKIDSKQMNMLLKDLRGS